jgi:membrane protein
MVKNVSRLPGRTSRETALPGMRHYSGVMSETPQGPLATPGIHTELDPRIEWRRIISVTFDDIQKLSGDIVDNWFRHRVPRLAASLAFYTLLSLAPLLIVVIAVAGAVFGAKAAEGQIVWQMQDLIGREGAEAVQNLIRGAQRPGTGAVAAVLGLLTLFYGATSVVSELRSALNTIWCVPMKDESGLRSLLSMLIDRTLSFAMVLAVGFLLLVSLAINAALSAIGDRFYTYFNVPEWALQALDLVISYMVITILFALLYKVVPDLHIEWRDVVLGAAMTAGLFSIGKTLIGMYLGKAGIASTYGAAGSLVIVLIWVYYSAQIFFLGAEFTLAYAQRIGSRPCDRIGHEVKIAERIDAPEPPPADSHEALIRLK